MWLFFGILLPADYSALDWQVDYQPSGDRVFRNESMGCRTIHQHDNRPDYLSTKPSLQSHTKADLEVSSAQQELFKKEVPGEYRRRVYRGRPGFSAGGSLCQRERRRGRPALSGDAGVLSTLCGEWQFAARAR
jgi:hypothetical protein